MVILEVTVVFLAVVVVVHVFVFVDEIVLI